MSLFDAHKFIVSSVQCLSLHGCIVDALVNVAANAFGLLFMAFSLGTLLAV